MRCSASVFSLRCRSGSRSKPTKVPTAAMDLRDANAFVGSPPCFATILAKRSSASAYAVSGMKKDTLSA
jgi:hypothetical protein